TRAARRPPPRRFRADAARPRHCTACTAARERAARRVAGADARRTVPRPDRPRPARVAGGTGGGARARGATVIALLRKDAPWLLFMLLAGSTALTAAWASIGFADVWLFPLQRTDAPFHAAWITGLLLGAVAVLYDDLLGTREFLLQRPVG